MSKPFVRLAPIVMAFALLTPTAFADADGHVNFFLGQKALDSGDWDPLDRQAEFGAVMSFGQDDWPIHIAVDVLVSADEDTISDPFVGDVDVTGTTFEIDAGVRKIWGKKAIHPYLGGGLAIIGAAVELDSPFGNDDADGQALGYWIDGGIFWRLGTRFNIGLDVRWSAADVDLDYGGTIPTDTVAAGGLSYGLLLGFGW
jgi:hypothetical protein